MMKAETQPTSQARGVWLYLAKLDLAEPEDDTVSKSEEKGELSVCGQRERKRKREFYFRNTKTTAAYYVSSV